MNPRKFSAWFLIAALICFLMPFFNVSCSGQNGTQFELAHISGVQLVTGTTFDKIQVPLDMPGVATPEAAEKPEKIGAVPLAAVDAALIAVAAGIFWAWSRRSPVPGMIATVLAAGAHLWLLVFLQEDWVHGQTKTASADIAPDAGAAIAGFAMAQVHVSPGVGWYTAGALILLAAVMQFLPKVKV